LQVADDDVDRRLQLVRRDRDELRSQLIELGELLRHHLVAFGQLAELVPPLGRERQTEVEVAGGHRRHPFLEVAHGLADGAPEQDGDAECQYQRDRERQAGGALRVPRLVGRGPNPIAGPESERAFGGADHGLHVTQCRTHVLIRDRVEHLDPPAVGGPELIARVQLDARQDRADGGGGTVESQIAERVGAGAERVDLPLHRVATGRVAHDGHAILGAPELLHAAAQPTDDQRRRELAALQVARRVVQPLEGAKGEEQRRE
jgi:hypothetical protein